jgi:hypothetical protein
MREDKEKKEAPKCDLRWEKDHFIVECETPEDRDRATKALEEGEVVVKVKVKKEEKEST